MESLKKNTDFKNCYNSGKSYVNKYLVLYLCGNGLGRNRFGISVSKKVGNSVVRHRVKRLIRETCRLHEHELAVGYDIVIVARVRAKELGFFKIENSLLRLTGKAGINKPSENESGKPGKNTGSITGTHPGIIPEMNPGTYPGNNPK